VRSAHVHGQNRLPGHGPSFDAQPRACNRRFALKVTARAGDSGPPTVGSAVPAGTTLFAEPDHDHVSGSVRYDHTPPAGGPHSDVWLNCGVYDHAVRNENAVHSLEHGTVWITYRPRLPRPAVARLRRFVEARYQGPERYLILSPYPGLPAPVVASAWGAQLRLERVGDRRLAAFVEHFAGTDQGGEPDGYCTGGTGAPIG
jgi:Protein of unknown function (DUF3105)